MQHMLLSRALWPTDGKCVPPHAGDGFASVHVTRELPAGAVLGACVLHNDFYDTLSFIALKARDSKNNCYAFRVDPETMRSSPLALSWLRLVQAARCGEEQNVEVFLKAGQLFFRTLRHIPQGEELLVWYDEELSRLLGLSDSRVTPTPNGFCCVRCGQLFQHEHPYLAHCRFLCSHSKSDWLSSETQRYKPVSDWINSDRRSHTQTDFHNIARDLERRGSSCPSPRKRCHDDSPSSGSRKQVLLEKSNPTNESNIPPPPLGGESESRPTPRARQDTGDVARKSTTPTAGMSRKAVTAVGRSTEDRDGENLRDHTEHGEHNLGTPERILRGSVHVLRGNEEHRSAFCRPISQSSRTHTHTHTHTHSHTLSRATLYNPPAQSANLPLAFEPKVGLSFRNVLGSALLYTDLPSSQSSAHSGYPYRSEQWPRGSLGVPPAPPTTLALLPPTLSPLGVSGQNWCAKCSLSFRMTSDLVLHMRSHHKREPVSAAPLRKHREERLSCPVCHEHFRERHHLSRHMTSHN